MKKLFDPDSPIMRFLTQAAELAWLNILWVVCSLPVVTFGASTAALCSAVRNMIRDRGRWNAAAFFRAFRDNFKKSTLLWLILLAALALIGADVFLLRRLLPEQILWLALPGICFALWLMVCIWVFPLTAIFTTTNAEGVRDPFAVIRFFFAGSMGRYVWNSSSSPSTKESIVLFLLSAIISLYATMALQIPVKG